MPLQVVSTRGRELRRHCEHHCTDAGRTLSEEQSCEPGWGGRIRTFNLLIQSNPRYRQQRFRIGLLRLTSELRSGSASDPGTQIWRETRA